MTEVKEHLTGRGSVSSARTDTALSVLSTVTDVDEALRILHGISGFELFALRLMWVIKSVRVEGCVPDDRVTEFEKSILVSLLTSGNAGSEIEKPMPLLAPLHKK